MSRLPGEKNGSVRLVKEAILAEFGVKGVTREQAAKVLNHIGAAIIAQEREAWLTQFVQPIGSELKCLHGHLPGDNDHMIRSARAMRLELEAAEAPAQAIDRRPIASAPLDGTVVILYWGEDGVMPGWYSGSEDAAYPWRFVDSDGGRYFINSAVHGGHGPSHWSPYSEELLRKAVGARHAI